MPRDGSPWLRRKSAMPAVDGFFFLLAVSVLSTLLNLSDACAQEAAQVLYPRREGGLQKLHAMCYVGTSAVHLSISVRQDMLLRGVMATRPASRLGTRSQCRQQRAHPLGEIDMLFFCGSSESSNLTCPYASDDRQHLGSAGQKHTRRRPPNVNSRTQLSSPPPAHLASLSDRLERSVGKENTVNAVNVAARCADGEKRFGAGR
eukprot:85245-Hanusia_phi.AAC.1